MRLLATLLLAVWLLGGLVLTLQPAHPLPRQVVHDNLVVALGGTRERSGAGS